MLILPENQRQLSTRILQRLALTQLVVFLPFIFALPGAISVFIFMTPVWIYWQIQSNRSVLLPRWIIISITLVAAVSVFLYFGTFRGKDAGVSLIVVMYSLKILEAKKYRDLNVLLTLAFFVLSMNFLFTQSLWATCYLFFGFLFIVQSLVIANSLSYQMLPWQQGIKLLSLTVPIMLLMFLFFPRLPGPLWRTPNLDTATTGVSGTMTPGDIGVLNLSDLPAFRVTFEGGSTPANEQMYWRGLVFESYDGLTWSPSDERLRADVVLQNESENQLDYSVTLESTSQRFLFGLDLPVRVSSGIKVSSDGTFRARRKIGNRIRYDVSSAPNALLEVELSPLARAINLALPEGFNSRSSQWSQEQYINFNRPREYVQFLLRYINQQPFYYTLTPPIMLESMVDDFWFVQQRGFCEHYSSSLVFMLRAAGIPARVVTGYQGGEYNSVGNYWLVMQRDAHAWAEFWEEGSGWVRVDPTAAIAPSRIDESLLSEMGLRGFLFDDLPQLDLFDQSWFDYSRQWFDNFNSLWREWVLDYDQAHQLSMFRHFNLDKLSKQQLYLLVVVVTLLIIALIGWRFVVTRQPLDKTATIYRRLLKKLAKKGYAKAPSEGPQDYFNRVLQQRPDWQTQLSPILRMYLQLRFAATVNSGSKEAQFKRQVSQLKL